MRSARWAQQHYPDPGALGSGGASTQFVFVLRPGDPLGARGNVYTDSDSLYAAMSQVQGGKRVEIDGTFAPVHWTPNDLQNLSGVEFFSSQSVLQGFTLNVDNGVKWTFDTIYSNGVTIVSSSASPVATIIGTAFVFIYLEGAILSTAAPFFEVKALGTLNGLVRDFAQLGDGTHPVIKVDFEGFLGCYFFLASPLSANAIDPASSGTANLFFDASSPPGSQAPFVPTLFPQDASGDVTYDPSVLANWSGISPKDVADALNRLAAKVGPVP